MKTDTAQSDLTERVREAERLEGQGHLSEALKVWRALLHDRKGAVLLCRFARLAMNRARRR